MKTSSLVSLAISSGLVAAAPLAVTNSHPFGKRQEFGAISGLPKELAATIPTIAKSGMLPMVVKTVINPGYGKVKDVPGAVARVQQLTNRNPQIPNAKTVKIRYGPYLVPNMKHKNFLGEFGALYNYPDEDAAKPCEGDCLLLGLNADLEYADGSNANVGNGMWLHHMVLFNVGPNRMDPTCVGQMSLPHILIGSDPSKSERLIASGNERSNARFNSPYYPDSRLGYFMRPNDQFRLIVDFMNENDVDKTVYLTMTYDYVDGHPEGFENFKSIWFDAAQCGTSEVAAPQKTGKFTIGPIGWNANLAADIIGAGGHLHDGGTNLKLTVDGKVVCDSKATYGVTASNGSVTVTGGMGAMGGGMGGGPKKSAGGMDGMAGMSGMSRAIASIGSLLNTGNVLDKRHGGPEEGGMGQVAHITAMSPCFGATLGLARIEKGQKWEISGDYDFDTYPPNEMGGDEPANIMAIAIMFTKNPTY